MTGGSSGGPWFRAFANGTTMVINSLNSYGYASLNGYMFGPVFDAAERDVYQAAAGAGTCPTSPVGYRCAA
jgi:hypothetical protein